MKSITILICGFHIQLLKVTNLINGGKKQMIYITGDIHGNKRRLFEIKYFCEQNHTTFDDYLIILGDVGINYCKDIRDSILKNIMAESPITFICIRGNHELRPTDVSTYKEKEMFGDIVYQEDEYPNIVFLKDGGEYEINGRKFLTIGGAYSVDKDYRMVGIGFQMNSYH